MAFAVLFYSKFKYDCWRVSSGRLNPRDGQVGGGHQRDLRAKSGSILELKGATRSGSIPRLRSHDLKVVARL